MKVKEYQYSNGLAEDFSKKGFLFGHIFLGAELPKKYVSDEEVGNVFRNRKNEEKVCTKKLYLV